MELRLSPTLLDAFDWYKCAPPSWKDSAYQGIVDKVRRAPFVDSPAMKKGRDFEDLIEKFCKLTQRNVTPSDGLMYKIDAYGVDEFNTVASICQGGVFQEWVKGNIEIGGEYGSVFVIGKTDVRLPEKIIDLKTTGKFRNGKYEKGWQHHFYGLLTEKANFDYVVAEWASEEPNDVRIACVHSVPIVLQLDESLRLVQDKVKAFFAFLKANGLWDEYLYTYSKNARKQERVSALSQPYGNKD